MQLLFSQGSLNSTGIGSNACTVIAGLVCSAFLHSDSSISDTAKLSYFFIEEMRDGNDIYNANSENFPSPFLNAEEAANLLGLQIRGEIFDVRNANSLASYLSLRRMQPD